MADKTVAFRPFADRSFSLTGNDADAGIIGELERSGGQYQRDLTALLRRWLPVDAVAVDGGAHIGVITVLLASLCPAGHVYAFEPAPENHAHLERNLAANRITNVTVERMALYRDDGEIMLTFDQSYPGGSHIGDGKCRVATTRLDSWAEARELDRLDLLKLDVEGAEPAALEGAEATLRRFEPLTVVECNPLALHRLTGAGYRELFGRLRALFPVVGLVGRSGVVVPLLGERHLELALNHHGVVDLIGLPGGLSGVEKHLARGRAAVHFAGLLAGHNRFRPPAENFIVDPGGIGLRPEPTTVSGKVAEVMSVPLEIRNATRTWLSSGFRYQPTHVSYRWYDREGNVAVSEGHRTPLPAPVAPGGSVRMDATVQLPAVAGTYQLSVTIVQEHYAWLDEIDPRCAARLPATVTEAAA